MKFNLLLLLLLPSLVFAQQFLPARSDYRLSFPHDHYPHTGFKTEWWYYTGFLADDSDREYGFQFTIFKVETVPSEDSPVQLETLWMVHTAVSDFQSGRFYFDEKIKRHIPGMAGFNRDTKKWQIENSALQITDSNHQMTGGIGEWGLDLFFSHQLPPVFHGSDGFSQKSPDPTNASHYYSIVDLTGSGSLKLDGKLIKIRTADAWMDHEFGSNALSEFQTGWDWTTITLSDSSRLMLFQVRGSQPFMSGTLISPDGRATPIDRTSIRWTPLDTWKSAISGAEYPVLWRVETAVGIFNLEPMMTNQELQMPKSGVTYWEGAIRVTGERNGKPVTGRGYLEMTGYANSMKGML